MSDILYEFMSDWENTKYDIPIFIIDNQYYDAPTDLKDYIHAALFIFWSYRKKILSKELEKMTKESINKTGKLSSSTLLEILKFISPIKKIEADCFNENARDFVVDYVANPGFPYSYKDDIRNILPNLNSYSEISENNYEKILSILDNRYAMYSNASE